MDIITICDKIKDLENYINSAQAELNAKAADWNISGSNMIDVINKFPF